MNENSFIYLLTDFFLLTMYRWSYRRWRPVRSPAHKFAAVAQHLVDSTPSLTSYVMSYFAYLLIVWQHWRHSGAP